ncbi:hypothetical protein ACIPWE_40270 [Streptomyces sp. NPDC090073]|uniref:hypothetical protein n=1 Tax=Streptomyces sp. NPDC090073 TaxID=3365936 RepID=UPI00380A80BC
MPEKLNRAVTGTAAASGALTLTIGPDQGRGAPLWHVTRVVVRNEAAARRGQPPIPTCEVYDGEISPDNSLDVTYDGSFDAADCDVTIGRGQVVTAVWAGAQAGDRLTLSVTGEVLRDGRLS